MTTNLIKYRDRKLYKKIIRDLEAIASLMKMYSDILSCFEKYVPVRNVLTSLKENHTLIQIYVEKYKKQFNDG